MSRTKYEVSYGKDKWIVERDGKLAMKGKNYATFNRKQDAVDFARDRASRGYSKLIIKNRSGEKLRSHKYGSNPTPMNKR